MLLLSVPAPECRLWGEDVAQPWAKSFYNSMAWQIVRGQVLRRDLFTCAYCYGRANEVHHKNSLTSENINDPLIALNPDNLISLCHDCHTKITAGITGDIDEGFIFNENGMVVKA